MANWTTSFPVVFTAEGDMTSQAIGKHINEISRIYNLLNQLRKLFAGGASPAEPENYQVWLNPATMEIQVFIPAEGGWVNRLRVQSCVTSDDSNKLGGTPAAGYALKNEVSAHIGNTERHVTAAERTAWDGHLNNEIRHITAAERTAWNGHAANADKHLRTGDISKLDMLGLSGASGDRPADVEAGTCYFDTTLGLPIWWNGTKWIKAGGDDA